MAHWIVTQSTYTHNTQALYILLSFFVAHNYMGLLIEIIKLTVNCQVGMNTVYGPKVYQSEHSCMISEICSHLSYLYLIN